MSTAARRKQDRTARCIQPGEGIQNDAASLLKVSAVSLSFRQQSLCELLKANLVRGFQFLPSPPVFCDQWVRPRVLRVVFFANCARVIPVSSFSKARVAALKTPLSADWISGGSVGA